MGSNVADHILERLHAWGVRRIFGYPGDGINALLGALDRMRGNIEFVQAPHEELAAFMACAHAKFTGELGVCLATSGPGAIHLLAGLYDAKADHQPVLAIVGQTARTALGGDYQQEVDLHNLFKDVAGHYVQTAMVPAQTRHLVDRAVRIARLERSVTCLIFPHDLQELPAVEEQARAHDTIHTGIGITGMRPVPPPAALRAAAELLNGAERVAILAGAGALHAGRELAEAADVLGAGVAKALLGKAALPDDLPFVTGGIGLLGTAPSWEMMEHCDALLMVGTSFPYSEYLPAEGQARGVQIDLDGRMLGLRYPTEVNLVGDSRATLQALLPLLHRKADRVWQQSLQEQVARWWKVLQTAPKTSVPLGLGHAFQSLVAVDVQSGWAALKWIGMVPPGGTAQVNINASILLSDARSGQLRCIMDARRATALRTAGMTAVAARHLAREDAASIGFIGAGVQAHGHLVALTQALPSLRTARIHGGASGSAQRLAESARALGLDASVTDAQEAVSCSDVVVTTVPVGPGFAPFLDPAWIRAGAFVAAIDLGRSWKHEGLRALELTVVDDEAMKHYAKPGNLVPDLQHAEATLADLVGVRHAGRADDRQRVLLASSGSGVADLAIAVLIYERALAQSAGSTLAT